MIKIALTGHREVIDKDEVKSRLVEEIKILSKEHEKCQIYVGTHGEFDRLALSVCRQLRQIIDLEIVVVLTSFSFIEKRYFGKSIVDINYSDVRTVMFDIEREYFKNYIKVSNQYMIDECDWVVAYVDLNSVKSGAKKTLNYAIQKNKKIIIIYESYLNKND